MLRKLIRNTTEATDIEYALIASIISVAAIASFAAVGVHPLAKFTAVEAAFGGR